MPVADQLVAVHLDVETPTQPREALAGAGTAPPETKVGSHVDGARRHARGQCARKEVLVAHVGKRPVEVKNYDRVESRKQQGPHALLTREQPGST